MRHYYQPFLLVEELLEILEDVAGLAVHIKVKVGPVKGGAGDDGVLQVETLDNVFTYRRTGSGCESHYGNLNRKKKELEPNNPQTL